MMAAAASSAAAEAAAAAGQGQGQGQGQGEGQGQGQGQGEGQGMGQGMGQGQGQGQGMGQGMGDQPGEMMGQAGPGGSGGLGTTGDGPLSENMPRQDGTGDYQETKEGESVGAEDAGDAQQKRTRSGRAWFASLPQAIRTAVKSRGKKTLPKGYEELLKRYFQD